MQLVGYVEISQHAETLPEFLSCPPAVWLIGAAAVVESKRGQSAVTCYCPTNNQENDNETP